MAAPSPSDASAPSKEDEAFRAAIRAVRQDSSLNAADKNRKIQELMRSRYAHSLPKSSETLTADDSADRAVSYAETAGSEEKVLGCKHYKRNCKMKAPCCGRLFVCRFCHDEHYKNGHAIDRYAVREMYCMLCSKVQPAAKTCVECKKDMARYYCGICHFWDDEPDRNIYHCPECGICRRGKGLGVDFFHCKTCNMCFALDLQGSHKCIERSMESNCPICSQYLFTSVKPVQIMRCGHPIHSECYNNYVATNYVCPICSKSLADMSGYFRQLDDVVARQPMPPEYSGFKARILCNDCVEYSITKFHFLYHKCQKCGSYNTKLIGKIPGPPEPQPAPPPLNMNGVNNPLAFAGLPGRQVRHAADVMEPVFPANAPVPDWMMDDEFLDAFEASYDAADLAAVAEQLNGQIQGNALPAQPPSAAQNPNESQDMEEDVDDDDEFYSDGDD